MVGDRHFLARELLRGLYSVWISTISDVRIDEIPISPIRGCQWTSLLREVESSAFSHSDSVQLCWDCRSSQVWYNESKLARAEAQTQDVVVRNMLMCKKRQKKMTRKVSGSQIL